MRRLMLLLAIVLPLTTGLAVASFTGTDGKNRSEPVSAARPPTPDPTYGLPFPAAPHAPPRLAGASARWIWVKRTTDTQRVGLRRAFQLARKPEAATLLATADNYFTLFVNGRRVGGTEARPGIGMGWQDVHRFDLTPLLTAGRNVIALEAKNAGGPAGAIALLQLRWGRRHQEMVSDAQWRGREDPPAGWEQPSFQDSTWDPATVLAELGGGPWAGGLRNWPGLGEDPPYLAHLAVEPDAVTLISSGRGQVHGLNQPNHGAALMVELPAAEVPEAEAPSVLVDFGREITGRVRVESASAAPVRVAMSLGESEDEALHGPYTGVRMLEIPARGRISGANSAFRYAKLAFLAGPRPIRIGSIRCDHVYYPVQYRGAFACSDPMLTRLWYVGAYTAHLCMQTDIWDAPKRDRARWMGDLHVSGEVINNVFLDRFLMQQTLDRLREEAGQPMRRHVNGIPGYSCAWVGGQADLYRHTGDLAYLKRQHDALIELLEFFRGELDDRGLFANRRGEWPFVDWSPGFNGVDPHALKATHLFMVRELKEGSWLLGEMGDSQAAEKYRRWADEATAAARRYLTDPATGTFGDRWQENSWALYSGVATNTQAVAIWTHVLSHRYPEELFITPYQHNYTLQAMSAFGHTAEALEFVRWYWGGMLAEGATSTWEGYDPRWPKEHFHRYLQADNGRGYFVSLAHGWSSGVTTWLTQAILGVRPLEPGMRRVSIHPELVDLSWVRGKVPTPRGPIEVSVYKDSLALRAEVALPPGTQAQFALPGRPVQELGPGRHQLTARAGMQ
jgi:alpha-L-rhamnosidase